MKNSIVVSLLNYCQFAIELICLMFCRVNRYNLNCLFMVVIEI